MGKLIYSAITSLDGYINDTTGNFDWAEPEREVHAFINDQERAVGTYLFGRRMYETMEVWETLDDDEPLMAEFAQLWKGKDKIVYSTTLDAVTTSRTQLERSFAADRVRALKIATTADLGIGGAELGGHALRTGLVDELHLFLTPILVGGGTSALPDDIRIDVELLDQRRFERGTVFLRYAVVTPSRAAP